ncbi:hypothetical protein BXZ70DRAFT_1005925 [Cristinia sonorae]|uniref:Uncharacterized protein n=1 Tax=Cristinia sonorae TaxID=1940300 RepID=A0A8K0UUD3_9AGAR|nr:hypothetical protein BXZ70DRAFT_1005925 [Cristinia sonorae]
MVASLFRIFAAVTAITLPAVVVALPAPSPAPAPVTQPWGPDPPSQTWEYDPINPGLGGAWHSFTRLIPRAVPTQGILSNGNFCELAKCNQILMLQTRAWRHWPN